MKDFLTWAEVSKEALAQNIKQLKSRLKPDVLLCACVKANAYGHGIIETSKIFLEAGADWLSINALYEAEVLRAAGITAPIYIMGYTLFSDLEKAFDLDVRLVVYNKETVERLGEIAKKARGCGLGAHSAPTSRGVKLHIKLETGNNRQGVHCEDIVEFANFIKSFEGLEIEGLSTHFANIEDTTDHSFAFGQVEKFKKAIEDLEKAGIKIPIKHCANSAAAILYPETHFDMVRVGISTYGMWPSSETKVSYKNLQKNGFELKPALTWKSVVAQIKTVPKGDFVGYGCTCRATRDIKMAIVPVGYYDGFDRSLSNNTYVLIRGQRAKILGRVCMNICMFDITDIPEVEIEDEVVLMGVQSFDGVSDAISAEQFAAQAGTINYEVTTRISERIPRIYV